MDNDNSLSLDERIASELLVTKDMTIEQLRELIQLVVLFLLEPASSNFQDGLSSYIDKYKINANILKNIVRSLIAFLQGAMSEGWTAQKLESSCNNLNIPTNTTSVLIEEWNKNKINMISSLLSKTITANKLIDLDWSFGVTAASNDCDQVG